MKAKRDITSLLVIFLSSMCFGINTSFGGAASSSIQNKFPEMSQFKTEWEWFINGPRLSAILGSIVFYPLVNIFGRRMSISIFGILNGVFYLLIIAANEKMMIYLLTIRIIHGLFWGVMSVITLVYLFELSHSSIHGFVGCMHQFFNVCGLVLTNILSAFLDFRIISIINAIISFIFSGLVWVTRDSPVSSRVQKLTKQKTLMKITDKTSQKVKKSKIRKYIKKKRDHDFYKYTIYGIILFVFQQLSGANAILSHLSQIMSNSGLSINPNLQSALANGSQLIAIFISALLVSNIGQRVLWCVSAFLCCLFLVLYSLTMKYSFPSYAQALFIFYYRLCFGFGVGPMTFATWVQLFSDKTRLLGTSIMMAGHFAISWVVVYCHPIISKKCGEFLMTLIYAVFMVLSIVFGACCIPENKVKDNEDMALI